MSDYELLYYIYQKDEDALALLFKKYRFGHECLVRRLIKFYGYEYELSDEFFDLMQMANMEMFFAIYNYRDDGCCSFKVYVEKCIEMGLRKYLRHKRCPTSRMVSNALRLDDKVSEGEGIYNVDLLKNKNVYYEGDTILKWYHESNLFEYLKANLKESEYLIMKMKLEGYSQKEIAFRMMITVKQVYYVVSKVKKLLRGYVD